MARLVICGVCMAIAAGCLVEAPCYRDRSYSLAGRTALIITTSHSKLGDENCDSCGATGVYSEELTTPYYIFKDAGMVVTLASIKGGVVPIDPTYNITFVTRTKSDVRFYKDAQAYDDTHHALAINDVDFSQYDIVFMAGGWGAAWDLGVSDVLADKVSAVYANPKQFLGSVCHGALGFIKARKPDGSLLCKGTRMTGVTNKQIEQLGIASKTPMHPEDELKKAGAIYKCSHGLLTDLLQNEVVVDGQVVTGQNQMASCQVPQELMTLLQNSLGMTTVAV